MIDDREDFLMIELGRAKSGDNTDFTEMHCEIFELRYGHQVGSNLNGNPTS